MIVDDPAYDVRYTIEGDGVSLKEWLDDPSVRREFPPTTEEEMRLFLPNWIGFYRFKSSLTAIYNEEVVGMATLLLMPYRKIVHHGLMYVVVAPTWQGQGIGTSLVKNLKHLAKDYFQMEMLYSEMYGGCKLKSILPKLGFKQSLVQEKFVKEKGAYRSRIVMEVLL